MGEVMSAETGLSAELRSARLRRGRDIGQAPLRSYAPTAVLRRCPDTGRPLTVQLPTGHRAEYMRTRFDCMRAALATLANVAYESVPDMGTPDISPLARSQALCDFGGWAHGLGCRLTYHPTLPLDRGAWVGCIPADEYGASHAILLCEDQLVHEPAFGVPLEPGEEWVPGTLDQCRFGITLDQLEASP